MTQKIWKITIEDEKYPPLLKKINDAPKELFLRGEFDFDEKCFAIVGTRKCTQQGRDIASTIAADLASAGLTVVSGLAPGIDSASHWAAVKAGKRTIAVLGTGVDDKSIYPQFNLRLAHKILENNGALISEYPPNTHGSRFTFPQRNRIIAGLSLGVLIVEAPLKSGAMITADWTKKQNKKIFAVPGSLYSLVSAGPNLLIKRGAKLVENANDILAGLNLPRLQTKSRQLLEKNQTPEEKLIMEFLGREPLTVDRIIELTKLEPAIVISTLTILESQGRIKGLGGNLFAING